jgi:hypothetical protein
MMPYIGGGMVITGILVFFIIVLVASGSMSPLIMTIYLVITIICIIGVLAVSFYAFQRVVKGDAEATRCLPAWDQAMSTWRNLSYCSRDDVLFDSKTNKIFTNEQFAALQATSKEAQPTVQPSIVA